MKPLFPGSLENFNIDRRQFMRDSLKSATGLALLDVSFSMGGKKQFAVGEIMELVLKEGNLTRLASTVDTLKSGNSELVVSGIVTTMFATINVIEETVKRNANFIIAHEPTFYNHSDNPDWVKNNSVTRKKQDLLNKHNIAVWRFHDYCHALKPDAISYGVAKKAKWLPYYKSGNVMLSIPQASLQELTQHLKSSLGISHIRIIGDLAQKCERIALLPGAWGGQRQVSAVETEKPDVLIVGELSEWETAEYIRDSRSFGGKTSLIILGHSVSEEPGMEWFAEWLQPKLPDVKISHIPSQDPFTWM